MVYAQTLGKAIKFLGAVVVVDIAQNYARKKGKELHEHVQNKGGYRHFAVNTVRVTGKTGIDTLTGLAGLIERGAVTFEDKVIYRIFPTPEELQGKYKGILGGLVFKSSFEACHNLRKHAEDTIPKCVMHRDEIIRDIGAYGITNKEQLIEDYSDNRRMLCSCETPKTDSVEEAVLKSFVKEKIVRKYL
jgi:imidazolonepropionase-like amidohydrolase